MVDPAIEQELVDLCLAWEPPPLAACSLVPPDSCIETEGDFGRLCVGFVDAAMRARLVELAASDVLRRESNKSPTIPLAAALQQLPFGRVLGLIRAKLTAEYPILPGVVGSLIDACLEYGMSFAGAQEERQPYDQITNGVKAAGQAELEVLLRFISGSAQVFGELDLLLSEGFSGSNPPHRELLVHYYNRTLVSILRMTLAAEIADMGNSCRNSAEGELLKLCNREILAGGQRLLGRLPDLHPEE